LKDVPDVHLENPQQILKFKEQTASSALHAVKPESSDQIRPAKQKIQKRDKENEVKESQLP